MSFISKPNLRFFVWAVLLCLLGACSQTDQNGPRELQSRLTSFPEPDLSTLGETVQLQISSGHQTIQALEAASERDVEKLAAAYGRLAKLYHAFGLPSQAQYFYERAIDIEPQTFEWQYLLARALQAKYEHDDAKSQFLNALQIDEFHIPSLLALGEYARNAGNEKEAKTYYNNALLLDKDCVFAIQGLAQMALKGNQFQEAVTLAEQALTIQPRGSQLHYVAAMAYRGLNNISKAEFHLEQQKASENNTIVRDPIMERVRKIAKQDKARILAGDHAFQQGNYKKAKEHYENAVKLNPSFGESRLKLATSLLRLGELDRAKQEFEHADRLRPGNYQIAFNLAGIALETNDIEEAKRQLQRALSQSDDFTDAHLQLADLYVFEKNYDKALSHYTKVTTLQPQNPMARVGRVLALIHLGNHQEAKTQIEGDLRQFPSHLSLGILLVKLLAASPDETVRDGKKAVTLVETMLKAGKTPELLEAGAMAYAETSRFKKAVSLQKEVLQILKPEQAQQRTRANDLLKQYQAEKPCRQPLPQS